MEEMNKMEKEIKLVREYDLMTTEEKMQLLDFIVDYMHEHITMVDNKPAKNTSRITVNKFVQFLYDKLKIGSYKTDRNKDIQ